MPSRYALTGESHLTVRCGARPWQNAVSAFKGVDDRGVAKIKDHKPGGLKQQRCILLVF